MAIYSALAEALAAKRLEELPPWMTSPGRKWPLYGHFLELVSEESTGSFSRAVKSLEEISASSLLSRWTGFEAVVYGDNNSTPIMLYESKYINGRVPGPITFKIQSLYKQAGLETIGAELPDHISMELAFLAHLAQQEFEETDYPWMWREARSLFIKRHAIQWMPRIGQQLVLVDNPAWKALGHLLIALIERENSISPTKIFRDGFPSILEKDNCNLCGFCVQVCPPKALQMIEDEATTALWFSTKDCIQCGKCEQICPEEVIRLQNVDARRKPHILRESPRVPCARCNQLMFSQAELEYTASRLNNPPWLQLCPECRINFKVIRS